MEPFATVDDLTDGWSGLDPADEERAATLLDRVSVRIAAKLASHGIAVDLSDETQAAILKDVTCEVVRRSLSSQAVADGMPVSQFTETATPYSNSYIFSNANGDLYLTKWERELLGLTGGRAAFAPLVTP